MCQRQTYLGSRITGLKVESLFDIIDCSSQQDVEIIKSCMIRALIQIDKSKNRSENSLIADCAYYMGLEARVGNNRANYLLQTAKRLIDMI